MAGEDIFNFHGLSRVLAEQDLPIFHARWMESLAHIGSFPFFELPPEIAIAILKLATTKSSTYSSLMRTSRPLANLARFDCVPVGCIFCEETSVNLRNPQETVVLNDSLVAISFYACISVHPGVGAGVKELWFIPALPTKQAATIECTVMNACSNVERLACFPDVLIGLCMGPTFRHRSLVDVTLFDPIIPWERLMGARHASFFFNRCQVLRLVGRTQPAMPPHGMSFPNLSDLTLVANTTSCVSAIILDHGRYPNLTSIVVTVPYLDWRSSGMSFLMSNPELADSRLVVVHCERKWKEIELWKEGASSIWNMGVAEWNSRNVGSTREWK
ncbi:hypothetical protein B0H11DRAFT_1214288 [Mycena galericulata]|nr:hypothetical protein B0H11DRAFT_1214288 [Mycena galericulata]